MLIQLLSQSNYGSFNITVAHMLNLETAVYLSELMNINEKALRKNKLDDNQFILDRKYITERTTLSIERQQELDETLIKIGVLEKAEDGKLSLNITVLTSILSSPDEQLLKSITKIAKQPVAKKGTKAEAIRDNLKTNIVTTNEELIEAYSDWIDAVYAKDGWMSKKSVVCAQNVIDTFSNRNLDVALKVIEIATINGYRNMEWAVNSYKKDYNVSYVIQTPVSNISSAPVKLSDEVF